MSTAIATALYKDHLQAIRDLVRDLGRRVTRGVLYCAARLLNVIKRWQALKGEGKWFWMPVRKKRLGEKETSFFDELLGEYCQDVIRAALDLLVTQLKLVDRQRNQHNGQDRTYQYKLSPLGLKVLLGAKDDKSELRIDPSPSQIDLSGSGTDKTANITTGTNTGTNSGSTPLNPEASVENSEPEEQPVSDTPPAALSDQENASLSKPQDSAEDESSAAPRRRIFEKFGIKKPRPAEPPGDPVPAVPVDSAPEWWQKMFLAQPTQATIVPTTAEIDAEQAFQTELEQKRQWLDDPVLRKEAIAWAIKHPDVELVTDEPTGQISIVEVEF